jgi:hypothetical protein
MVTTPWPKPIRQSPDLLKREHEIDKTVEDSFPASDPPSATPLSGAVVPPEPSPGPDGTP